MVKFDARKIVNVNGRKPRIVTDEKLWQKINDEYLYDLEKYNKGE